MFFSLYLSLIVITLGERRKNLVNNKIMSPIDEPARSLIKADFNVKPLMKFLAHGKYGQGPRKFNQSSGQSQ
jgi:hypothetical protein